jgi:hypothetical protein
MAGQSGVVAEDHPRDPGMVSRARSALTASRMLEKQAVLLLALQGSMSAIFASLGTTTLRSARIRVCHIWKNRDVQDVAGCDHKIAYRVVCIMCRLRPSSHDTASLSEDCVVAGFQLQSAERERSLISEPLYPFQTDRDSLASQRLRAKVPTFASATNVSHEITGLRMNRCCHAGALDNEVETRARSASGAR